MSTGIRSIRLAPDLELSSLRDFVAHRIVAAEFQRTPEFEISLYNELQRRGILQAAIPRKYGGREAQLSDLIFILKEIGSGSMSFAATIVGNLVAQLAVISHGTESVRASACRESQRSASLWSFAVAEPESGNDLASTTSLVQEIGEGYLLNGSKILVVNGTRARHLVVLARLVDRSGRDRGLTCFYVDGERAVIERKRRAHEIWKKADVADLSFKDVRLTREDLVGGVGRGMQVLDDCVDRGKTLFSAATVGASARVFDHAQACLSAKDRPESEPGLASLIRPELEHFPMQIDAAWLMVCRSASLWSETKQGEREATMALRFAAALGRQVAALTTAALVAEGLAEETELERSRGDVRATEDFFRVVMSREMKPTLWLPPVETSVSSQSTVQHLSMSRRKSNDDNSATAAGGARVLQFSAKKAS